MIKYRLGCEAGHEFESWFHAIGDYDAQRQSGFLACPICGSTEIAKQPMAPALVKGRGKETSASPRHSGRNESQDAEPTLGALRTFRQKLIENTEDVGPRFADEARRIHFGEAEERGIRGKTTAEEARAMLEDGVPFGILPPLPEDLN
jgi:hypothetical protein